MIDAPILGLDRTSIPSERNYSRTLTNDWELNNPSIGTYMIRAQIGYEISKAEFTTPENNTFTNEPEIMIEGTAYQD
ncbi:hypothetical protein [Pseudogracilibacillus sp. SO30301A]|uniref:hypothetical protein n=1 Tax=Pseudogracilibacillus sp. SO30301A TaxID=3098291 RepID=UPI00300E3137